MENNDETNELSEYCFNRAAELDVNNVGTGIAWDFAGQEALKLEADRQALIRWGKDLIECDAIEPRWENSKEWIEMPEHLRNELGGN